MQEVVLKAVSEYMELGGTIRPETTVREIMAFVKQAKIDAKVMSLLSEVKQMTGRYSRPVQGGAK
jgi:hypothetical protein